MADSTELEGVDVEGVSDEGQEANQQFLPDYINDSPSARFFTLYIVLPLLVLWICYAYFKTFKFAYNTMIFYKRFNKRDEKGQFEIPTKNVHRRNRSKGKGAAGKAQAKDDHFVA